MLTINYFYRCCSDVFTFNFETFTPCLSVSIIYFEHVKDGLITDIIVFLLLLLLLF